MVYGAGDAVSVVIRQSLIQLRTPSDMLGRVMAVNAMCTGSSGTLGEFRAGVVAAWLGAVPSALIGGLRRHRGDAGVDVGVPAVAPRRQACAGANSE